MRINCKFKVKIASIKSHFRGMVKAYSIINMKQVLLIPFFLVLGASAFAQTSQTPEPEKEKEEVVSPESKEVKKEVVKSVPATKGNNAKPERVDRPNKNGARPSEVRPARSPRPVNRNSRPGRGR